MIQVLDTNAVLYLLMGRLADPLPPGEYVVSVITEIELLSFPALDAPGELRIRRLLTEVDVVSLTAAIKEQAVALRRQYRLKIPDAIIAATAVALDAELLTNDTQIHSVEGLRCRALPLKPA